MRGQIPWSCWKKGAHQLRIFIKPWWTNLEISKGPRFPLQLQRRQTRKRLNLCLHKKKIYFPSKTITRTCALHSTLMRCKWTKSDWTLLNFIKSPRQSLETEKKEKRSIVNQLLQKLCTKNQTRIRLVSIQTWFFPWPLKMSSKSTTNFSLTSNEQKSNRFQWCTS